VEPDFPALKYTSLKELTFDSRETKVLVTSLHLERVRRNVAKKTRVGIIEEAVDRCRYRMSLHPNFALHYQKGGLVYFETIDSDGKLKRVTCTVEPAQPTEDKRKVSERERLLVCQLVYDVVQESQVDLASPPAAGKVVYLVSSPARNDSGGGANQA